MYNAHRGMVPAPNNRLTELLDQVRAEFDNQQNRTGEYEQQSKFACGFTCLLYDAESVFFRVFVAHNWASEFKTINYYAIRREVKVGLQSM